MGNTKDARTIGQHKDARTMSKTKGSMLTKGGRGHILKGFIDQGFAVVLRVQ